MLQLIKDALMAKAAEAKSFSMRETLAIWKEGVVYGPGDIVFPSYGGLAMHEAYTCREQPFGDFCGAVSPSATNGDLAWVLAE